MEVHKEVLSASVTDTCTTPEVNFTAFPATVKEPAPLHTGSSALRRSLIGHDGSTRLLPRGTYLSPLIAEQQPVASSFAAGLVIVYGMFVAAPVIVGPDARDA
jgi:hypothetical protein